MEIDPVKQQAVKDALEFCANRKQADITEDAFIQLVNKLYQFYTKWDGSNQE